MQEKKRLSSGRWLVMFLVTLALLALCVPLFNYIVDPYGAFGDRFMQWWSYDETLNPRLAKVSYLQQNADKYDSFIVGSSGSSSLPTDELNEYLDARFYNCFFYGSETSGFEEFATYLLKTYEPKNLVLNLSLQAAHKLSRENTGLTNYAHWRVSGESPVSFYAKYLFADPMDSVQKLQAWADNGYLLTKYRVFNADTGAYDKSLRDIEPIGDLEEYLSRDAYAIFNNYPQFTRPLTYIDESVAAVARIKQLCEQTGTRLIVLCQPTYIDNLAYYSVEEQARFFNELATVTDYWDFTCSSVSYEPRYFYDEYHSRNAVGTMQLARIFGSDEAYVPADFGRYVAQGDTPGAPTASAPDPQDYTAQIPILCYHNLCEGESDNDMTISAERFREHMEMLEMVGYHPISFSELRDYVEHGAVLPDKPILITFDDGYRTNYTIAYPILQQFGYPATIFTIGLSVGKDEYRDTGRAMEPHFSLEEAAEMEASGLITVASHGYDVHEVAGLDPEPVRKGVLRREGESEQDYVAFLTEDARKMFDMLGEDAAIFSYPYGKMDDISSLVLSRAGVNTTVLLGKDEVNTVIRGLPQSMLGLTRLCVYNTTTIFDLLAMLP